MGVPECNSKDNERNELAKAKVNELLAEIKVNNDKVVDVYKLKPTANSSKISSIIKVKVKSE